MRKLILSLMLLVIVIGCTGIPKHDLDGVSGVIETKDYFAYREDEWWFHGQKTVVKIPAVYWFVINGQGYTVSSNIWNKYKEGDRYP